MKNKKKLAAIITSWLLTISTAAGTAIAPLSVNAFAADEEKTFDGIFLDDDVPYYFFNFGENASEVDDSVYKAIANACGKKASAALTYRDLAKITSLNLSNMELKDIPLCLKYMTNLYSLNLSNNLLTNTDNVKNLDLRALKKLNSLYLTNNYLTSVPSWYVLDSIKYKNIDNNLLKGDNQRSIKAQTPVYYFMDGEEVDVNDFRTRILSDIVFDDGKALPPFMYIDNIDGDPYLSVDLTDFETKHIDNGAIKTTQSYERCTVEVKIENISDNKNATTTIEIYLLDGSDPSTVEARLNALYDKVKDYPKDNYTEGSFTRFESALKTAEKIKDFKFKDAEMLKNALEQLDAAARSLTLGINSDTKSMLTELVNIGKNYKEEDYTPESWGSLQSAVERITEISSDANATLSSAKRAILAFQNAQRGLEKTRLSTPSIIPKADFEKIYGEEKKYVSTKGTTRSGRNYEWKFEGKDLTAPADFNPEITDAPTGEDSILIESGKQSGYFAFSTQQSGTFPGEGIISLNVSEKFNNAKLYLYKWNSSGEFIREVTATNGTVSIPVSEGGTYYISTVLQRYELTSDKLKIDAEKHSIIVPLLGSGFTAGKFKNLFKYGDKVTIYDAENNPLKDTDRVKTGMKASSPNGAEYVITVMGDVDGDGCVIAKDSLAILKYYVNAVMNNTTSTDKTDKTDKTGEKDDTDKNKSTSDKNKSTSDKDKSTSDKKDEKDSSETEKEPEKVFGMGVTGINVADVNGDGYVNARDALEILKASAR